MSDHRHHKHLFERTWKQYPQTYVEGLEPEVERYRAEIYLLREALEEIIHELGVPGPGYPAPVSNAYDIAKKALNG